MIVSIAFFLILLLIIGFGLDCMITYVQPHYPRRPGRRPHSKSKKKQGEGVGKTKERLYADIMKQAKSEGLNVTEWSREHKTRLSLGAVLKCLTLAGPLLKFKTKENIPPDVREKS